MKHPGNERALKLAERLIKASPDPSISRRATRLVARLNAIPMSVILEKVRPGDPVAAKVKAIGVSRQTYYYWLQGETRPNKKQAKRLAQLTDFSFEQIRGHAV